MHLVIITLLIIIVYLIWTRTPIHNTVVVPPQVGQVALPQSTGPAVVV